MNIRHPSRIFIPPGTSSGNPLKRMLAWLYAVCIELHPATSGCRTCRNCMLSSESRLWHWQQPQFPIDVVYTWVDGSDPLHAMKRSAYISGQKNVHDNGLAPARFRDNDELRYSLRSLELFAPWIRSIILVTDNQAPRWLETKHPKIRIVDHSEFIPERFLPTYNSHVIEAYLHRIPNLAEHYIYLNDDVFLARPCRKTDFFTPNGLPLSFIDWRKRRIFGYKYTKTPHAMSYFNTLKILNEKKIHTDPNYITAHGPYPQTKTNVSDAFEFYKDIIEGFAVNKFRTTDEIAMYSHALPLWIYGQKRVIPCDERYYYVQTNRIDRIAYYKAILNSKTEHMPPLFFCINDVGDEGDKQQWRLDLRLLLSSYYSVPSPFEADMR